MQEILLAGGGHDLVSPKEKKIFAKNTIGGKKGGGTDK